MQEKILQNAAMKIAQHAYAPYSKFHVGAALLCMNGEIITGVNVENCAYGLTSCAERNAIGTAVALGHQQFLAAAIFSPHSPAYITPCGACRQVMAEFMDSEALIYLGNAQGEFICKKLGELLPLHFKLNT